jgi:hypothetical protein
MIFMFCSMMFYILFVFKFFFSLHDVGRSALDIVDVNFIYEWYLNKYYLNFDKKKIIFLVGGWKNLYLSYIFLLKMIKFDHKKS